MFQFNPLSLALLGACTVLAACGSSTGDTTPPSLVIPKASMGSMADYTPFGPTGSIRVPFWKRHVTDSAGSVNFEVVLDRAVPTGGATLEFEFAGTAEAGVHYFTNANSPMTLAEGTTEVSIPIQMIPSGEFFSERFLQMKLVGTNGIEVVPEYRRAQLWIRPSVNPPTLSVPTTEFQVIEGSTVNVALSLSHVSQEPVTLHYTVDRASDLLNYDVAPSGALVFLPGQLSAMLPIKFRSDLQSGQTLELKLNHERDGVRYVIPPLNPMFTSLTGLTTQDIHLDENMWTHSVGGVQQFENDNTINLDPDGRALPGTPSDNITGGSFWEDGMEDQSLVNLLDQTNPTPILDPFSGVPLKIFSIAEASSRVVPYLRKSFDASFCGSTTQLYTLPEYARISYYVRLPEGPDAFRAVPFVRVGMRLRTLNFNHGVIFRIGSEGFDSDGNPVPVVQTTLGPIGLWDLTNTDPATDRYGVVQDEFGVRIWHAHHLDASMAWTHPNTGETIFEVPGEVSGNPIEYPTWVSVGDGSLTEMGLSEFEDATGMGNLSYGYFWEVSDDDSIFNGDLRPYTPKPGNWWEPRGNAVLPQSTTLRFQVP